MTPKDRSQGSFRSALGAFLLFLLIALVGLGLDQGSKNLVEANMQQGQTIEVLGNFLRWQYVVNPGAAFSLGISITWVFTIIALAVSLIILWYVLFRARTLIWRVMLGILMGGVLGNLLDRFVRAPGQGNGHVVDFINVPWILPAVFNIADILILVGLVGLLLLNIFSGKAAEQEAGPENPAPQEAGK